MNANEQPTAAERRRAAQRADVREDILQAARDLVESRGARALTMRAIANRIDYSPGAIYEYFSSKADILEMLYFQGAQGLEGRTRQVLGAAGPNATVLDRAAMAGRAYRSFALDHPDLYLLIFSVSRPDDTPLPHELEPRGDSSFGSLVGMLREAIERGEIADGDPEEMAAALWAYVHGFVMLEITGRMPNDPPGLTEQLFETGLHLLSHGLRPRNANETRKHSP